MCHSRINYGKINRLHEICHRIICNGKTPSFEILLEKDGPVSVHNISFQVLAREMFKMIEVFHHPIEKVYLN